MKSMLSVDLGRFSQVVSPDDFESDTLLAIMSSSVKIDAFSINSHSLGNALQLPPKQSNMVFYDCDVSLVPQNGKSGRKIEYFAFFSFLGLLVELSLESPKDPFSLSM